jgi:hypothetical protein
MTSATARRIDQARTQGGRQLVGVVDAIPAGKLVVGKDLGEVEVRQRRVEDRYVVLLLVRDVEVEQSRLERLRIVAVEPVARTLESHPGIDAENRQRAADRTGPWSARQRRIRQE